MSRLQKIFSHFYIYKKLQEAPRIETNTCITTIFVFQKHSYKADVCN